jgi:hypothetical protein
LIAVDTTVLSALILQGREPARNLLLRDRTWVAPRLWRTEFRGLLMGWVRGGRLSLQGALERMELAVEVMAGGEHEVPWDEPLRLATASGITPAEGEFVALARALGLPLHSDNPSLRAAFPHLVRPLG